MSIRKEKNMWQFVNLSMPWDLFEQAEKLNSWTNFFLPFRTQSPNQIDTFLVAVPHPLSHFKLLSREHLSSFIRIFYRHSFINEINLTKIPSPENLKISVCHHLIKFSAWLKLQSLIIEKAPWISLETSWFSHFYFITQFVRELLEAAENIVPWIFELNGHKFQNPKYLGNTHLSNYSHFLLTY